MQKKKLLIICTVAKTFTDILKDQIKYLDIYYDVVIVSSQKIELENFAKEQKVKFIYVNMERKISIFKDIVSLIKLRTIIAREKPYIVHSFTPKAGLLGMLASRVQRVPNRIHTFTGLIFPYRSGINKSILKLSDKIVCLCANMVVAEGNGVKNDLLKNSITKKDIKIIGNGNIAGVNTEHYNKISKTSKPSKEFKFVFIGRVNFEKGILELIEASNKLSLIKLISLDIIGELEINHDIISKKINSSDFINLRGHVVDIRPHLENADVLVLPSYREGFPNVILQAFSMGIPVIATNISGCNEIIEKSKNGWLVEPKNTESLYKAMLSATTTSHESLKKMGRHARETILLKYDEKHYREKLLEFYRNL